MVAHTTAFLPADRRCHPVTDGYAQTVVRDFGPEVTRWIASVSAVKKARATASSKPAKTKLRPASLPVAPNLTADAVSEAVDDIAPTPSRLQIQGYNCIEFVVPGTRFYLEFSVEDSQMASGGLGLFLQALREFVLQQNLGGWTKNGFGRFEVAQMTIRHSRLGTVEQNVFGSTIAKAEFDEQSPLILEALDQWAGASARLCAAEIEKLYELTEA